MPADKAGLQPGDRIVGINGVSIHNGAGMVDLIHNSPGRPLQIKIVRDNVPIDLNITPNADQTEEKVNGKIVKKTIGHIGITPDWGWKRYTPAESIRRGTRFIYNNITMTLVTLFSRNVRDNVGGPIAIASQIHHDTKAGPRQVMLTAAFLSVSLGIINLFPIPILDGGHLVLLAVEGIRRRKLSSREVYASQMVGLSIIVVLFVLVMYNDIVRLIVHNP
jgi:regulator of sigma E protease